MPKKDLINVIWLILIALLVCLITWGIITQNRKDFNQSKEKGQIMDVIPEKTCKTCKLLKKGYEFDLCKKYGIKGVCKSCRRIAIQKSRKLVKWRDIYSTKI